jgi:hypothetical protein
MFPYGVDVQRAIAHDLIASLEPVTVFRNVLSAFVQVFEIAMGE